jgi:hypothetical protein
LIAAVPAGAMMSDGTGEVGDAEQEIESKSLNAGPQVWQDDDAFLTRSISKARCP